MEKVELFNLKKLTDIHTYLGVHIKAMMDSVEFQQLSKLEDAILSDMKFSDIMPALENKMAAKFDIKTILRLISLLSVTKSGLD